jgi:hypothetical protein
MIDPEAYEQQRRLSALSGAIGSGPTSEQFESALSLQREQMELGEKVRIEQLRTAVALKVYEHAVSLPELLDESTVDLYNASVAHLLSVLGVAAEGTESVE